MRRDLSDFQLNSALGRFDGRAYEALLETTGVRVDRLGQDRLYETHAAMEGVLYLLIVPINSV